MNTQDNLSLSLVKAHRKLYIPIFVTSLLLVMVTGALFTIGDSTIHQVTPEGMSKSDAQVFQVALASLTNLFKIIGWSNAGLGFAIIFTLLKELVSSRREEIAQLRLMGFPRGYLWRIHAKETLIVQLLAAFLGTLALLPTAYLIKILAVKVGYLYADFQVFLSADALLGAYIVVISSGQLAVGLFYHRQRKANILLGSKKIEFYTRKQRIIRFLTGIVLLVLSIVGLVIIPINSSEIIALFALLSVLLILPVILLASEIIIAIIRIIEWVAAKTTLPYTGILLQRFKYFSRQQTRLMLPILLTVGCVGGFFVGANAIYGAEAKGNSDFLDGRYCAVADQNVPLDWHKVLEETNSSEAIMVANYGGYTDSRKIRRIVTFLNSNGFEDNKHLKVLQGSLTKVAGNAVAVDSTFARSHPLNSELVLNGPDEQKITVKIVAVVEPPSLFGVGILANIESFPLDSAIPNVKYIISAQERTWTGFSSKTSEEFLSELLKSLRQSQQYSNLFFFGFIYFFAAIVLVINLREMLRSRLNEFEMLSRIGFTSSRIRKNILAENLLLIAFSLFFLSVALVISYLRISAIVNKLTGADTAEFPWFQTGIAFSTLALISLITTVTFGLGKRNESSYLSS